ncbi:hypothetical protein [Thalassolituus oleivorans]|jgi:hypothetical protein|uniref:Uncharacterized protein n=1 Tax=Thalassolituus oleivorans MIL-1 TaxID=1298593 RepID=M5DR71_9GAMM|nr:hypothetical protein [Thalassolituus oleivorans]AHK17523.1 hypothetical protein R615_07680 [Thalassolituus oleivorans R6-15]CCU72420.1 hypothetical protein TOL_2011 [Thalassolituus oleivorans MIL-1]
MTLQLLDLTKQVILAASISLAPALLHGADADVQDAKIAEVMAPTDITESYVMPVWVDQVQRVCPWRSNAGEGYIRLIRSEHDGRHGIILQWIRKGIAGAPTQAISTIAVTELDTTYQVRVKMPEPELSDYACYLTAMGEDMMTEQRYKFDWILKGPGEYEFHATHMLNGGM